jgi:hypothetical protein
VKVDDPFVQDVFFLWRNRSYIPGQRQIEVSKDVTFKEEVAFRRSRGYHMEIDSKRQEEMVPSPPHPPTVQRETIEPIDPLSRSHPPSTLTLIEKRILVAIQ